MSKYSLTMWQVFQLWLEDERTELGMELVTYYGVCALCGVTQAMSFAYCLRMMFN